MRIRCLAIVVAIFFSLQGGPVGGQQTSTSTSPPQASTLLMQAAAALSGSVTVSDVTLTGTAQNIAGSDNESGTASLKAMSAGESSINLSLSGGTFSEIRSFDSYNSPVGTLTGLDGVQHTIPYHNLQTDSSWFFPALTVEKLTSVTGLIGTYVGQETLNGQSALHVSFAQPVPVAAGGPNASIMQHLTQMELYLDPATALPIALSFATHPDNNELYDIPVQILFSNYQSVNGVEIPFHVQKFLNGTLALDLQMQSAVLNSGLTASGFAVQISQ
jgi:hypothetical protein